MYLNIKQRIGQQQKWFLQIAIMHVNFIKPKIYHFNKNIYTFNKKLQCLSKLIRNYKITF